MRNFLIVLKKELLDCFRDRRSIAMMLMPLLIYPILLAVSNQQLIAADDSLSTEITLATYNETAIVELVYYLKAGGLEVNVINDGNQNENLKSGKVLLVVDKTENGYHILFNQGSIKSTKALGGVTSVIEIQKTAKIHSVLNLYGESPEFLNEYNCTLEDVTTGGDEGDISISTMLGPMMILLFIASSGTGVALDLFCGEKERGSLESLLSTQVNRKPLYFAQVIAVLIFGGIGVIISVGGYMLSFLLSGKLNANVTLGLGTVQMLLLFAASISFAFFTSNVICALAISAKSTKEGSLRLSLFTIIPSLLSGLTMFLDTGTTPMYMSFVPIYNVVVALKSIFVDVIVPEQIALTIASNVVYGLILLFIGQRIMNSERVLDK